MHCRLSQPASIQNLGSVNLAQDANFTSSFSRTTNHGDEDVSSQATSSVDEGPSPLEYARMTGLCVDFTTTNPFYCLISPHGVTQNFKDENISSSLDFAPQPLDSERLEVEKEALELLQSVLVPPDNLFLQSLPSGNSQLSHRRLEPPILETDHEVDSLHFGTRHNPNFQKICIPFDSLHTEEDESLEWPRKYFPIPVMWMKKIEADRLEMSKSDGGVELLLEVLRPSNADMEMEAPFGSQVPFDRKVNKALITPPLLPISLPVTPFKPSIDASNLPLFSDQTNSTLAEAEALDEHMAEQDSNLARGLFSHDSKLLDSADVVNPMYEFSRSDVTSFSPSPVLNKKQSQFGVEVPLLSIPSSSTPTRVVNYMSFPQVSHGNISKLSYNRSTSDAAENPKSLDTFFEEVIQPIAYDAHRTIEQEQLQEADSTVRVNVPILDFAHPTLPWKIHSRTSKEKPTEGETELASQQRLLIDLKKEQPERFTRWSGLSKYDRLISSWKPCPHVTETDVLDEGIDDASYISTVIEYMSLEDVVVSNSLTWKPEGLRILDDFDQSDEELEARGIEDRAWDSSKLTGKRRRELEDETILGAKRSEADPIIMRSNPHTDIAGRNGQSHKFTTSIAHLPPPLRKQESSFIGIGQFCTASALTNFMHTMGMQSKIDTMATRNLPLSAPPAELVAESAQRPSPMSNMVQDQYRQANNYQPHPGPPIPNYLPAYQFILATDLLRANRGLIRAIKQLYSTASYIERDFATIPTMFEADILLSPTTAMVVTMLQKIHQRPLPGQKAKNGGLKQKVLHLSVKYERIIVFVSEGLMASGEQISAKQLEQRDCDSLNEISAFGASLGPHVQVTYVAGGNDELARWIVAAMAQYGMTGSKSQLLEEETLWEQILRRAGFNAYAAQIVLANLKEPNTDVNMDESSGSTLLSHTTTSIDSGLRYFMRMDPDERVRRFEGLLGGSHVLRRVNKVLEQGWLSAADGFRAVT